MGEYLRWIEVGIVSLFPVCNGRESLLFNNITFKRLNFLLIVSDVKM